MTVVAVIVCAFVIHVMRQRSDEPLPAHASMDVARRASVGRRVFPPDNKSVSEIAARAVESVDGAALMSTHIVGADTRALAESIVYELKQRGYHEVDLAPRPSDAVATVVLARVVSLDSKAIVQEYESVHDLVEDAGGEHLEWSLQPVAP